MQEVFILMQNKLFIPFTATIIIAYACAILTFYIFDILLKKKSKKIKIQVDYPKLSDILFEFYWSVLSLITWIGLALVMIYLIEHHKIKIYFNMDDYGLVYFIITATLTMILHDTYFYWGHRFMHINNFIYKLFHKVHHHSTNPTALSIFSFAPTEAILLGFYAFLIPLIIPIHIYVLLLVFSLNTAANIIGHMGYYALPKKIFGIEIDKYFFTELQHNKHHQDGNTNFAIYFDFWDRIMGTKR